MIKKKLHQTKFKQKKAYSLIELAIVITILSILVTGSLVAVSKVYGNAKYNETNYKIAEIYKALGAYFIINGKLPCPASTTALKSIVSSQDNYIIYGEYGVAIKDCQNLGAIAGKRVYPSFLANPLYNQIGDIVYGMVPVVTLGLSKDFAEDGFGSKFAYMVNYNFTDLDLLSNINYQGITYKGITIKEATQNSANNQTITTDAIFAIISYGFNKNGALNTNIADIRETCISSDDYEQENDIYRNLTADETPYCHNLSSCPSRCPYSERVRDFDNVLFLSSSSTDDFDDIVFYKTRNDFLSDFDALSFIKCKSSNLAITYGTNPPITFSWPDSTYNQIVPSSVACPNNYQAGVKFPTRRCGSYGNWETNSDGSLLVNSCKSP